MEKRVIQFAKMGTPVLGVWSVSRGVGVNGRSLVKWAFARLPWGKGFMTTMTTTCWWPGSNLRCVTGIIRETVLGYWCMWVPPISPPIHLPPCLFPPSPHISFTHPHFICCCTYIYWWVSTPGVLTWPLLEAILGEQNCVLLLYSPTNVSPIHYRVSPQF